MTKMPYEAQFRSANGSDGYWIVVDTRTGGTVSSYPTSVKRQAMAERDTLNRAYRECLAA